MKGSILLSKLFLLLFLGFVGLGLVVYFGVLKTNLSGDFVAMQDESQLAGDGSIVPPYALLHLRQTMFGELKGYLLPIEKDEVLKLRYNIKEGYVDSDGYLQLEVEEEVLKNVSVGSQFMGIQLSAPLASPSGSLSSVSPVKSSPDVLELSTQFQLGGALGMAGQLGALMTGDVDVTRHSKILNFYRVNPTRLALKGANLSLK